ncbi:MAG: peptidylprolyl isomerase [Parasporobacterium sp.]|nr:peptidylprolyl isomerase [Parasporobacterium sp.]
MAQNPVITIEMENGDIIKAELYPETAPQSVYNFISLAGSGYYDGLIFHRVIKGFMIQGGDPLGTGTGGPGYRIKGEFSMNGFENPLAHTPGVLSMARANHPDSAGSQFFIMHEAAPYLDGQYAAFGKVIEGLENVDRIACTATDWNDRPREDQRMKKVTVETFGVTYPEPEKL